MPTAATDTPTPVEAEALLRAVEHFISADGWDQPHYLGVAIRRSELPVALLTDRSIRLVDASPAYGDLVVCLAALGNCEAHQALAGLVAPPSAIGVILVTEGWMAPAHPTAPLADQPSPSEHPQRVEIRSAAWAGREGPVLGLARIRGQEPEMWADGSIGGRLPGALLRVMGRSTGPSTPPQQRNARCQCGSGRKAKYCCAA